MILLIPENLLKLHKGDKDWLLESLEKGLYSVDIDRLQQLIKANVFKLNKQKLIEVDTSDHTPSILTTYETELNKLKSMWNLNDKQFSVIVAYLITFGFLIGEV